MVRPRLFTLTLLASALGIAVLPRAAAETVLLDFTAAQCGPCAQMEPVLRQLAEQGQVIRQIDVARDPRAAAQYRVTFTPTFIVLVDGREWARVTGWTSYDKMVEMIQKAAALSAAHASSAREPDGGALMSAELTTSGRAANASAAAASQPLDGRVVAMQDPFAIRTSPRRTKPVASISAAKADESATLVAATVRLSVADPNGKSTGTGAVVAARNGMALVLTCGHLFRTSEGRGAIEISLFSASPAGAELRGKVAGELLDYDLDRDLALVRFRTDSPVTVTPIAPPGTQLEPGALATSVGCSGGDNPTAWPTRITAINRFQGHPNVEAARAPVEGRSGGGLFNAEGQLIGVCFAADPEADEGLYASLPSIHAKLDELQLSSVYRSPTGESAPGPTLPVDELASAAAAQETSTVRGQSPSVSTTPNAGPPAPAEVVTGPPSAAVVAAPGLAVSAPSSQPMQGMPAVTASAPDAALGGLSAQERAALEEIALRSAGSEVICIIRPPSPNGRSDVIKIKGVSPAFVRALAASAESAAVGPEFGARVPAVAAAQTGIAR